MPYFLRNDHIRKNDPAGRTSVCCLLSNFPAAGVLLKMVTQILIKLIKNNMTTGYQRQMSEGSVRRAPSRGTKWMYLGVVVGSPVVHIMVSLYRNFPKYRKPMLWAIVGTTVGSVITRVWLFGDSGFIPNYHRPIWKDEGHDV
jgi:hypothetical protein